MPQNGNLQPSSLQNRNPVYQHCTCHKSTLSFFSMLNFAGAFFSLFLFTYLMFSHCIILKLEGTKTATSPQLQQIYLAYEPRPFQFKCFLKIRGENIRKSRMLISQPHGNSLLSALVFIKYCVALAIFFYIYLLVFC